MNYNLRDTVQQKLVEEVFKASNADLSNSKDWKVLVIDDQATKILSSALKVFDLTKLGVTVVERLELNRKPLLYFEAIYIISASSKSFDKLIQDFENPSRPLYKGVHVYALSPIRQDAFEKLSKSNVAPYIKNLVELNLEFLAKESHIYTTDSGSLYEAFSPNYGTDREAYFGGVARRLSTLCVSMQDYCHIGYYNGSERCKKIAEYLNVCCNHLMETEQLNLNVNGRGQLIILDRNQDALTPMLHDMHYQAMIHDLLPVEKDIYKFTATNGQEKELILTETEDKFWPSVRHMHIADAIKAINNGFRDFKTKNHMENISKKKVTVKELQAAMQAMPEHQRDVQKFSNHVKAAETCMKQYNAQKLDEISDIEQILATGKSSDGATVKTKEIMSRVVSVLANNEVSESNKLRLLIVYILVKHDGIRQSDLEKLLDSAEISQENRKVIYNLPLLGVKVTKEDVSNNPKQMKRITRNKEGWYADSRYVPLFQDIIESCINGDYSKCDVEFTNGKPDSSLAVSNIGKSLGSSNRSRMPAWSSQSKKTTTSGPRVVIYIVGGLTYAEARIAYEISKATKRTVVIGSDHICTPQVFMDSISKL